MKRRDHYQWVLLDKYIRKIRNHHNLNKNNSMNKN
jgi:hypothetical protein